MPRVNGVLETALYVADLDRSVAFYRRVFGFEPMLHDERMSALRIPGRQVLLLFKEHASTQPTWTPNGTIPPHDGHGTLHLAFAVEAAEIEAWQRRLAEQQVAVESELRTERGGHSLYFRDPDGHLIEIATPQLWPFD